MTKCHVPFWSGRILIKSLNSDSILWHTYQASKVVTVSQHIPLSASFTVDCRRYCPTCFSTVKYTSLVFTILSVRCLKPLECREPALYISSPLFPPVTLKKSLSNDLSDLTNPSRYEWNEETRVALAHSVSSVIDRSSVTIVIQDLSATSDDGNTISKHRGTAVLILKDLGIGRDRAEAEEEHAEYTEGCIGEQTIMMQRSGRFVCPVEVKFTWAPM